MSGAFYKSAPAILLLLSRATDTTDEGFCATRKFQLTLQSKEGILPALRSLSASSAFFPMLRLASASMILEKSKIWCGIVYLGWMPLPPLHAYKHSHPMTQPSDQS